jgi:hypothetical protein
VIRALRSGTPGQWALRVTMVVGVLGALMSTGLAGVWPAWWLVLLVGGLAVGYAALPETSVGTAAMGLVLVWWGAAFGDEQHSPALVAAGALLAAHLAGVLVAYGPDRMAVDRATVVLWVRRGAAVFLTAPLVYLVAGWVRDQPEPDGIWVTGLAVALAAVGAMAAGLVAGKFEK